MEKKGSIESMDARREFEKGDEISLIELWLVLVARKRTVVIVFVIALIVGGSFALLSPEKYIYTTTVGIAKKGVGGKLSLIESIDAIRARLTGSLIPHAMDTMRDSESGYIGGVDVNALTGGQAIQMTSLGRVSDLDQIKKMHSLVIEKLINEHELLVDAEKAELKKDRARILSQIDELTARINMLKHRETNLLANSKKIEFDLENLYKRIESVKKNNQRILSDSSREDLAINIVMTSREYDVLAMRVESLEARVSESIPKNLDLISSGLMGGQSLLSDYQKTLSSIEVALSTLTNSYEVSLATKSVSPTGPGAVVIMALSAMMGLFFGTFVAFMQEFITRAHSTISRSNGS